MRAKRDVQVPGDLDRLAEPWAWSHRRRCRHNPIAEGGSDALVHGVAHTEVVPAHNQPDLFRGIHACIIDAPWLVRQLVRRRLRTSFRTPATHDARALAGGFLAAVRNRVRRYGALPGRNEAPLLGARRELWQYLLALLVAIYGRTRHVDMLGVLRLAARPFLVGAPWRWADWNVDRYQDRLL